MRLHKNASFICMTSPFCVVFINIPLSRVLGAVMISKISLGIYVLHKAPRRNSGNQMNRFQRNVLGGPHVF